MSTAYEPHQAFHRGTAPIFALLTPEQTERLSQLQGDPTLVDRLAELAEKANAGELDAGRAGGIRRVHRGQQPAYCPAGGSPISFGKPRALTMDAETRATVRRRAAECCEYCQRRQIDSPLIPLQIEHIIARKHGGPDSLDNLALACAECNLHKGSDLSGLDPESDQLTRLYHPRKNLWHEHFTWSGVRIIGLPPLAGQRFVYSI